MESIFPGGQAVVAGSTMRGAIPAISHTHGASNCQRCGASGRGEKINYLLVVNFAQSVLA